MNRVRSKKDCYKGVATEMARRDPADMGLSWFGKRLEGKCIKRKCIHLQGPPGPESPFLLCS